MPVLFEALASRKVIFGNFHLGGTRRAEHGHQNQRDKPKYSYYHGVKLEHLLAASDKHLFLSTILLTLSAAMAPDLADRAIFFETPKAASASGINSAGRWGQTNHDSALRIFRGNLRRYRLSLLALFRRTFSQPLDL
jgi:hypothetical protein